jgi:hypothetical protein
MLRRKLDEYAKSVIDHLKNKGYMIIKFYPYANFFGQESLGLKQIRGNGTLVLTDKSIIFALWKPNREFTMPLNEINGIEKTKWHLKKTKGIMMLRVLFTNTKGEKDSIAWIVDNLQDWIENIEKIDKNNIK